LHGHVSVDGTLKKGLWYLSFSGDLSRYMAGGILSELGVSLEEH
jgi:hypothetical protein